MKTPKVDEKSEQKPIEKPINVQISNKSASDPNLQSLFEEFFIIGVDKDDLSQATYTDDDNIEVEQSKILFSFPDSIDKVKKYIKKWKNYDKINIFS